MSPQSWKPLVRSIGIACAALLATAGPASAQVVLNANPGPANNGLSTGQAAIFFDLTSTGGNSLVLTEMTTAATAAAGAQFTVEVFTRVGTALGGPVASGPGSSPAGWTSLGTALATQGATTNGVTLPIDIPDIALNAGELTGVAVRFLTLGPRYFGTGTPPLETYSDAELTLVTGNSRSTPFTTGGTFFSSRALVGSLTYTVGVIPEPSSMLLASMAGMWGLRYVRRRRKP